MKGLLFLTLLPLFWACSEENGLTVNNNNLSNSLIPSIADSVQYSSSSGDTISFYPISESTFYLKNSGSFDQGGSISNFDFIDEERREVIIGNTAENLQFKFNISAKYQSERPQYSRDEFLLSSLDTNLLSQSLLNAEIQDSIICLLQNAPCFYLDSLQTTHGVYQTVFSNNLNGTEASTVFISPNNGLVKFIDRDNVVFELIP